MENITLLKLRKYQKFGGDDDIWSRGSKRLSSSEEWFLIRSLIQDISLVKKRITSIEYKENLSNDLLKYCDSEATVKEIGKIALALASD
jgi:hypothetical protein